MRWPLVFLLLSFYTFQAHSGYSCSEEKIRNNTCKKLVKLNHDAALGKCLPEGKPQNIAALLKRNNIEAFTGPNPKKRGLVQDKKLNSFTDYNDVKIVALARVVNAFEKISKKGFKPFEVKDKDGNITPIQVVFNENGSATNSRRIKNQIQLTGGNQNASGTLGQSTCNGLDNHGLIAHELAHFVAGSWEEGKALDKYHKYMNGERCKLTSYSSKNLAEELAEVIAAYITMPQMFDDKGNTCKKAFTFVKDLFGESQEVNSCETRIASIEGNQPDNVQYAEIPADNDEWHPSAL